MTKNRNSMILAQQTRRYARISQYLSIVNTDPLVLRYGYPSTHFV